MTEDFAKIDYFEIGDLIEVTAADHTTYDDDGWETIEELQQHEPERITVVGYYVGETEHVIRLAMAKAGPHYGTLFIIIKAGIEIIRVRKGE